MYVGVCAGMFACVREYAKWGASQFACVRVLGHALPSGMAGVSHGVRAQQSEGWSYSR